MALTFYALLWIGGGNDIIATTFNMSINSITWFLRVALFILPPIAFVVTKRICLGLQRKDREKLLHGREAGRILRLPHGEFIEVHEPLSEKEKALLLSKHDVPPLPLPAEADENGVANKKFKRQRRRARLSHFFYGDNIPVPSAAELAEAEAHVSHDAALEAPLHEHEEEVMPVVAFGGSCTNPVASGPTPSSSTTAAGTCRARSPVAADDAGGTGCRHGHAPSRNPTLHPRLGMVPSASNAVLGAVVVGVVLALAWWWFPGGWALALTALAALGLAVSAVAQLAMGHRGRCWAERTVRWWLGPAGAMVDPFDVG